MFELVIFPLLRLSLFLSDLKSTILPCNNSDKIGKLSRPAIIHNKLRYYTPLNQPGLKIHLGVPNYIYGLLYWCSNKQDLKFLTTLDLK